MNKTCYYRGYRDDEGQLKGFYWKLLVVRLAFVIIFEVRQIIRYTNSEPTVTLSFLCYLYWQHVVFGVCRLIDILVPDIPQSLAIKLKRERYLAKQVLQDPDHVIEVQLNNFH
jgi:anoctamin-7